MLDIDDVMDIGNLPVPHYYVREDCCALSLLLGYLNVTFLIALGDGADLQQAELRLLGSLPVEIDGKLYLYGSSHGFGSKFEDILDYWS